MKKKSESYSRYLKYEPWAKVQRGAKNVRILGSDRGGEFMSKEFKDHLDHAGMARHLTVHDSPQSNRMAERGKPLTS